MITNTMSISREYINYARHLSSNANYSKAFNMYIKAFVNNPQLKEYFEKEFRETISQLNVALAMENKIEDIFSNFGKAIDIFPNNYYLWNETGQYLYKFGYYEESWTQFQRALKIEPGYVSAEKNLNSVKNMMVERWHFRMLNDKIRNDSYRAAIHEMVTRDRENVLDLGSGTGLLAMYASELSPMSTIACDKSEVMTTLTDYILDENKLLLSVIVVNKLSTAMTCRDVGELRSLLVTEVFDAGLFGEHALQSLSHAWEHLLSEEAKVIPYKAEFFVVGVNSDLLNAKYQLQSGIKSNLNIPNHNVHVDANDETYDSEDVHFYHDIQFLTKPRKVVTVKFNSLHDIQEKLESSEPINIDLQAKENGIINTYIGWFNLHLTKTITITTNPTSKTRANAWQQAVFFNKIPKVIKKDDIINLKFLMNSGKLTLLPDINENILKISREMIKFLNDADFLKMIKTCIGMACIYLGQIACITELNIIDLSPFPMFGLLMMQRGLQSLFCYAKNENDKQFIKEVFKANKIESSNVKFLIGNQWSQDVIKDEKFHAIFCNTLDISGELDMRNKDIAQNLKSAHMFHGGLFMPANVTLVSQIVSSHWLDINNVVYDENVGNYKIGSHINKYQVSQNFGLDYTHLEYIPLTEPVELGKCSQLSSDVINVPIVKSGEANAIICWYNIELMEGLEELSTKRPCSFIDGTAFLANPKVPMTKGHIANILCCVDSDNLFKLVIDVDT